MSVSTSELLKNSRHECFYCEKVYYKAKTAYEKLFILHLVVANVGPEELMVVTPMVVIPIYNWVTAVCTDYSLEVQKNFHIECIAAMKLIRDEGMSAHQQKV